MLINTIQLMFATKVAPAVNNMETSVASVASTRIFTHANQGRADRLKHSIRMNVEGSIAQELC